MQPATARRCRRCATVTKQRPAHPPVAPPPPRRLRDALLPVLLLAMFEPLQFDGWQWIPFALATPVVLWGGCRSIGPRGRNPAPRGHDGRAHLRRNASPPGAGRSSPLVTSTRSRPACRIRLELHAERRASVGQIYLEVAAVVVTFVLDGRYVERRAKRRPGRRSTRCSIGAKDATSLTTTTVASSVCPSNSFVPVDRSSSNLARR